MGFRLMEILEKGKFWAGDCLGCCLEEFWKIWIVFRFLFE